MKPNREICESCGGYGHHGSDGEGRYYSCYACGETGWVEPKRAEPDLPEDEPPLADPGFADRAAAKWWADRTNRSD